MEKAGLESHFYSTSWKIQETLIAHMGEGLCSVMKATF